jgi:CheY-like chemotaxis protein
MPKVLFIEDHEAQRDIMRQVLEQYGYEFDVACTGEEGVDKAREWQPDVVLIDIRMPGRIDGVAAIRELRTDPDTSDIPIIVVSAWENAKHREQVLKAGADALFTKPVAVGELIEAIKSHLREPP